ncbi:MAG: response regulator transcription factor [Actinomycetota bacterium]|nr:response regulator transcription factor [Actinomycetota bacterium]
MSEARVLVVEDDASVRDLLVAILRADGYEVHADHEGLAALRSLGTFRPDLLLLDAGLPDVDGHSIARRIRQSSDVPIVFVTGADSPEEIRAGFRAGADDYVVKPFDPEELSWRVRAVLRRSGRVPEVFEVGDLVVDEGSHSVTRAGAVIALTVIEFKLLSVLLRNRHRVVPKSQLLWEVWGYEGNDHVVEVHMSSLRRKLEAHGPRLILTVRGVGYILRP